MKIIPLSEGSFTVDKTKHFIPFDKKSHDFKERSAGSLLVEIQPFAVITSRDVLLLDTGLGFSNENGRMQLHDNLSQAGINPGDVTKVLMTHLHKDHAGGVSDDGDRSILSFPKATYLIQRREFDFALQKGFPSFIPEELVALKDSGQVEWLDEDEGVLDGYINYMVTGGHSPYHQVFWIKENGVIAFFGGDEAPQLHQMKHRFSAKYDHDGKKAMEWRRQWWEKGNEENWKFLFYHDIKTPVYPAS